MLLSIYEHEYCATNALETQTYAESIHSTKASNKTTPLRRARTRESEDDRQRLCYNRCLFHLIIEDKKESRQRATVVMRPSIYIGHWVQYKAELYA